jgi:hypothetical protein
VFRERLWGVVLAAAFLGGIAVPVVAATPDQGPPSTVAQPADFDLSVSPPGPPPVATLEAERKQEEKEEWRASAGAAEQRLESREAYKDASASEASSLIETKFPKTMDRLAGEPGLTLSDAGAKPLSATTATIGDPNPEAPELPVSVGKQAQALASTDSRATDAVEDGAQLIESTTPIATEDESGKLSLIDLDLIRSDRGFEPESPGVELALPEKASGEVAVGSEGLRLSFPNAASATAKRLEGNLAYVEALHDVDLLLAPLSRGVYVFASLR